MRHCAALWPARIPLWFTSVALSLYAYPWPAIRAFFWILACAGALFLTCQVVLFLGTAFKLWEVRLFAEFRESLQGRISTLKSSTLSIE